MRELTVGVNLIAGAANTIYTVPKGCTATATLLFLANGGGTTKAISAAWHDYSENTSVIIAGDSSLGAGSYIQFSNGRMVMDEFDHLVVTPEAGSTMSCIFTIEINQNTAYQKGN